MDDALGAECRLDGHICVFSNPFLQNLNRRKASDLLSRDSLMHVKLKGYELLYATLNQDLPTVKVLLQFNITNIDFQGEGGYTALLIATEEGSVQLLKYLLKHGASPNISNDDGFNALELAENPSIKNIITPYLNQLTEQTHLNPDNAINIDTDTNETNELALFELMKTSRQ